LHVDYQQRWVLAIADAMAQAAALVNGSFVLGHCQTS
jgi:hypothetical protein